MTWENTAYPLIVAEMFIAALCHSGFPAEAR